MAKNFGKWLISGPPVLYLVVFFVIPTCIMVLASFRYAGEYGGLAPIFLHDASGAHLNLTLESYREFFSDFIYSWLFIKTLIYALVTTFFCLLTAYPLALLIARSASKYRDLLVLLVILPFWSNFLIRIYAWMILLGPQSAFSAALNGFLGIFGVGPVRLLFTPFAVVLCLIYVQLPFMVLPLYANLEKHDPALLDAAQDLGANGWQRFWRVTFPLSLPGIYAGIALVFVPVLGIFAVPDILGGTRGIMIGNLIKQEFLEARDWPFGSALSIMLTIGAMIIVGGAALVARRRGRGDV